MAKSADKPSDIFDVKKIRKLVELMNANDLDEIDLSQGDQRIRLRRGVEPEVVTSAFPATPPAATPPELVPDEANVAYVTSPMVGTFYSSSTPDADPFVAVGDDVGPESIICIVEAMKVFNEIPAEVAGKVMVVLVENGAPVEFGQRLFKVSTN